MGLLSDLLLEVEFVRNALIEVLSTLTQTFVAEFKAYLFSVGTFRTVFQEIVLEILDVRLEVLKFCILLIPQVFLDWLIILL